MDNARESMLAILPVPACEYRRKYGLATEFGAGEPACLRDVLCNGLRMHSAEVSRYELRCEPELDMATLRIHELFDIQELGDLNFDSWLFENLAHSGMRKRFIALSSTTRTDPEVVLAWPVVPDQKEAAVVLDDGAGGNAMEHCEV
jgi:hypothetical protein